MLSFLTIMRKSLLVVVIALGADGAIAYLLTYAHYAFAETIGDFMLVEAAALFILAGLVDFYPHWCCSVQKDSSSFEAGIFRR